MRAKIVMQRHPALTLVLSVVGLLGCGSPQNPSAKKGALAINSAPDVVLEWNNTAIDLLVRQLGKPPQAAEADLTYMHAAIYDAVNSIEGGYSPYVAGVCAPEGADSYAAAAQSGYAVLVALYPANHAFLAAALQASLSYVPDGRAKSDGIEVGHIAAGNLLAFRDGDGRNEDVPYTPGTGQGVWRPTPPGLVPALTPWLAVYRPFAIRDADEFRAEPPPELTSETWSRNFNEVKSLGAINSGTRSPAQTDIGRFWTENNAAQVNRLFRKIATAHNLTRADNARLFAQFNMTVTDAYVACWDSKFTYNFWRPVTAIQTMDPTICPTCVPDASWNPLAITPAHPEYPAAHGCYTAAWTRMAEAFFGTDNFSFSADSTVTNTTHTFSRFSDALVEVKNARVYAGIHYRTSCDVGARIGAAVAEEVSRKFFRSNDEHEKFKNN